MEFLIPFGLEPNAALLDEYANSEVTKRLNIFPTLDFLDKKFENDDWITIENYNKMKNLYRQ